MPSRRNCSMVSKICWMTMGPAPARVHPAAAGVACSSGRYRWPASAARRRTWCRRAAPVARAGGEQGENLIQQAALLGLVDEEGPISRFSSTVRRAKMRRPSGTTAMSLRMMRAVESESICSPRTRWSHCWAWVRRTGSSAMGILPAPLAPIRVTISLFDLDADVVQRLNFAVVGRYVAKF